MASDPAAPAPKPAPAQKYFLTTLPGQPGFHGQPPWWPMPAAALGGVLVALALHYLPGTGGHHPTGGFKPGGTIAARDLPAIVCAALATLSFGAVLGPEAPLIAIGGGVGRRHRHPPHRPATAADRRASQGADPGPRPRRRRPRRHLRSGAAGGIALSHLPGLPLIDGAGIGIGAMLVVMLGAMPLTSALLTIVFLASDAIDLISVVIVAVVVAWVASAHLSRWLPLPSPAPADGAAIPAPGRARPTQPPRPARGSGPPAPRRRQGRTDERGGPQLGCIETEPSITARAQRETVAGLDGRVTVSDMEIVDGAGVVVTGGGGGIGRAIARRLAAEGARVVVNDLDPAAAETVAAEIKGFAAPGDAGTAAGVAELIAAARGHLGEIDVYCSNAGTGGGTSAAAPDDDVWQRVWEVNTMAHVRAARELLPGWLERGRGTFVITASAAGLLTMLGAAPYSVTKHAAEGYAEWLAATYSHCGLTVHCICPQGVRTQMLADSGHAGETVLMDAAIEPEQVADALCVAMTEGRFLVLPHPEVRDYYALRATDTDKWLRGMNRLQRRIEEKEKA